MKEKVGVYGGSFNPPHIAHKISASFVMDELRLDRIIFVPSGNHPLKDSRSTLDASHRFNMARLAFESDPRFEVSGIELDHHGENKSYTVDTLEEIRNSLPDGTGLVLIIGADNLLDLHRWKDPHRLFELAEVAVMQRPGSASGAAQREFLEKSVLVEIPLMDISSTMIRKRRSQSKSIRYMVDDEVHDYILKHRLYI